MSSCQLPQELLGIIVSLTLEAWPAHTGTFFDAAVASRLENPFHLVSKACRQIILDDLANTLWVAVKWHKFKNPIPGGMYRERCRPLHSPQFGQRILSGAVPTLNLVVYDRGWTPDIPPTVFLAPFNYEDFASTLRVALSNESGINLFTSHMTARTSRLMDNLIKPLLTWLLECRKVNAGCFNVKIFGEHISHSPGSPSGSDSFNYAKLAYREYQRLKAQYLNVEAGIFALQVDNCMRRTLLGRREHPPYWLISFARDSHFSATAQTSMQTMKIVLEFAILANSTDKHLFASDPIRGGFAELSSSPRPCQPFWGFSDLDIARWCHAAGNLLDTRKAFSPHDQHVIEEAARCLALASAMFPDNLAWKSDSEQSAEWFREYYGTEWQAKWTEVCRIKKIRYLGADNVWRDQIKFDDICLNYAMPIAALKCLPMFQILVEDCLMDLERELGIEDGDWQMNCMTTTIL